MIPIVPLLPIVNSQQKLIALMPHFQGGSGDGYAYLLNVLQQVDFFERLSPLFVILPISQVSALPMDFAERACSKNIVLSVPETNCIDKEVQQKLAHFSSQGMRILMDDFNSKSSLIWPDTKGIIVDCGQGIPSHVQPWLFSLQNNQHLAKNLKTLMQQQAASDRKSVV